MTLNGIDIASHQEGIDVSKVKADFIIVKVSGGTSYVNDKAHEAWRNWYDIADEVLKSGKLLGLYHYAGEYGIKRTGKAEAEFFLKQIKKFIGKAVLCLDWEATAQSFPVSYAKEWLDTVAKATGATPMFYGYASYLNSRDHSAIAKYPLWMASYLNKYAYGSGYVSNPDNTWSTGSWKKMTCYQYSSTRKISGYGDRLDIDVFYGDKADWLKLAGASGAQTEPKKEEPKVTTIHLGDVAAAIHRDMVIDNDNGYSWDPRWGEDGKPVKTITVFGRKYSYDRGSYDCASSVITAWKAALKGTKYEHALDGATYTGNMRSVFVKSGLFVWKPMSFIAHPGDLYLNESQHVAMCQTQVPDMMSEFCINEKGEVYGGKVGDQTGKEAAINPFREEFDGILHYNGKADFTVTDATAPTPTPVPTPSTQPAANLAVDGDWGPLTTKELKRQLGIKVNGKQDGALYKALRAKIGPKAKVGNELKFTKPLKRSLQRKLGVEPDGIIGPITVKALQRALNKGKVAKW